MVNQQEFPLSDTELYRLNMALNESPSFENAFDRLLEEHELRDRIYDQERFVD
jgi:hypothetical protein